MVMVVTVLEKFVLSSIRYGSSIIIYGRRATGKTTLIKDLCNEKNFGQNIVFSSYPHEFFSSKGNVYDIYDPSLVKKFDECVDENENPVFIAESFYNSSNSEKLGKNISGSSYLKDPVFMKFVEERDLNGITVINAFPQPTKESLNLDADYIFAFKDTSTSTTPMKSIYKEIISKKFESVDFESFEKIYKEGQKQDHSCFVIDIKNKKFYTYKTDIDKLNKVDPESYFSWFWP